MHPVVTWSLDDIERQLGYRGGCREETATIMAVFVLARTVATKEGGNDTWELDRAIDTDLVVVHAPTPCLRLPLIGTMYINIQLLTATEGIPPGNTHLQLGTHTTDSAMGEIGLDIEIVWTLERAVEHQVKGIAGGGTVTRGELKVGRAVKSCGIELIEGLLII